jgi:hypothetical protein
MRVSVPGPELRHPIGERSQMEREQRGIMGIPETNSEKSNEH